jgi:hypothetical protein
MTDETTNQETTTPQENLQMQPEHDELAALKSQLADTAKSVLAGVPENLRGLIPASLAPADQIAWFHQAKATGAFDKPVVLPTDGGARPSITPTTPATSSLPIHARLAAGYSN